jgi:hypothetical protein
MWQLTLSVPKMEQRSADFLERLARPNAPIFLCLGQRTLALDTGNDIFLTAALAKYSFNDSGKHLGYSQLFDSDVKKDPIAARAWTSDRANLLTPPAWLEKIAQFGWNGVYTSTVDGMLNRAFRSSWRNVQPLYSSALQPSDPRNRSKLHISYLYGSVDRDDPKHAAPLSFLDLKRREPDATALLNRIPEQLTPAGTLVIEAYNPESDWLNPEKLYPVLMALEPGQAYLFSAKNIVESDVYLQDAISAGKLVVFTESLASLIAQGMEKGIIPTGDQQGLGPNGHRLTLGNRSVIIPEQFWSQISRYGVILDDTTAERDSTLSPAKRYTAFRSFLAESGVHPVWSAHVQGLPFERDFEREVFLKAKRHLSKATFESDPIIVHGQTGSGKTIALANVALRLHFMRQFPAIFIARRNQRFNHAELDAFCKWAEDNGFPATLIVWDGMYEVDQYYILHKYLVGRGRKVVIIGSTYKLSEDSEARSNAIEASAVLSSCASPSLFDDSEIVRFKNYLSSFEPTLGDSLDGVIKQGDASFLVALYRLLPDTRGQVRAGLHLETGAASVMLRENANAIKPEAQPLSILQIALERVKLYKPQPVLPTEEKLVAGEWVSAEQELIGLIMVPGRFGLQVPIEILLRAVSHSALADFSKVIAGIDLFRWSEDNLNNISVGARHSLEAKLIAQTRLGGAQAEIEYAKKLLLSVRRSQSTTDTTEVQFASEFIRSLGPNGPEGKLYFESYLDLASTLAEARQLNGVQAPRLMLQEASLLREATVLNTSDLHDAQPRIEVLQRAQKVLEEAITLSGQSGRMARLKSMLYVELASTYGAIARELMRSERNTSEIMSVFQLSRTAAMKARSLMPEDFFPVDVIAWSTKDLLTYAKLDTTTRLEIIVGIFDTFAMADGDEINRRDKEKLERRRAEFALLLDDEVLAEEALAALAKMGSTVGYYLQAVSIAGGLPFVDKALDDATIKRYSEAAEFLSLHSKALANDPKCLYLYLRYWWCANARLPFYPDERTCVPFDGPKWSHALQILGNLIALDGDYENPFLIYLQAICKWQLGYYDDAMAIWRDLQRVSDRVTGRRRITKTYLSSSADGHPLTFNGIVTSVNDDGSKGEIFVERLRISVAFFPKDFGREDIRKDEELSGFHIAFNYIAPTADPAHHYKNIQRS